MATREFLHLLEEDAKCKDVPFLWFSDRDPDGINIFSLLLLGSMSQAYASPSTVCSKLEWAGLVSYYMVHQSWLAPCHRAATCTSGWQQNGPIATSHNT
jgi:DNA topoisomerase VI subunit A